MADAPDAPDASDASDPPPGSEPARAGSALSLRGVERTFANGPRVLDAIDLSVPAGQFVALLGPSGCGKSTLLRAIAGLDRPTAGEVSISGRVERGGAGARGARRAGAMSFVFQQAQLLPWRTLQRNVELPLELAGVARGERRDRAAALIEQVGLADAATRYPGQLSGGMQMRASLARALITRPRLLLLDEPFAALDEITRQRLDEMLYTLWRQRGITVVFVTHAITEAVFLAQRAIMLSRAPARIVADRAIELGPRGELGPHGERGPGERDEELRTTAAFGEHVVQLHRDLRRAEGAPGDEPGEDAAP